MYLVAVSKALPGPRNFTHITRSEHNKELNKVANRTLALGGVAGAATATPLAYLRGASKARRDRRKQRMSKVMASGLTARGGNGKFVSHSTGYGTVTVAQRRARDGQAASKIPTSSGRGKRLD